jgi:3-oxoacyl-[acyl-carrier protein] reductase
MCPHRTPRVASAAMVLDPSQALLTDQVAVVTGAARGIGAAIAAAFARFGADLALCDRDADGLAATAADVASTGRRVVTAVLDVRDADAVAAHLAEIEATFGRVDVLVNNAGGTFFADLLDVSDKGQHSLIDENFTSVTHFIRGCLPLMPDGSSIIGVTSIEAHQAAPGFAVYAAMKAAVESLSMSLALELGPRRIRCNTIAPDAVPTPGDQGLSGTVQATSRFLPTFVPPLGHAGHPDDCAGAAVFLASPLSRFVTGTTVHVSGGNRAAGGWRSTDDRSAYTLGDGAIQTAVVTTPA